MSSSVVPSAIRDKEVNAKIAEIVKRVGQKHLSKRKLISTRIWNHIYKELEECSARGAFSSTEPLFKIEKHFDRITIWTNRRYSKEVKVYILNERETVDEIVKRLQEVLAYYDISVEECSRKYKDLIKHTVCNVIFSPKTTTM